MLKIVVLDFEQFFSFTPSAVNTESHKAQASQIQTNYNALQKFLSIL